MTKQKRGIRNNNPGNIRHGADWKGLAADQPDPDFCKFETPEYGLRAMGRTLLTYFNKHGIKTVDAIINRWAPPTENDTASYIKHVSSVLGVTPHQEIDVAAMLHELVSVIIYHENGKQPYSQQQVETGCNMARGLA